MRPNGGEHLQSEHCKTGLHSFIGPGVDIVVLVTLNGMNEGTLVGSKVEPDVGTFEGSADVVVDELVVGIRDSGDVVASEGERLG